MSLIRPELLGRPPRDVVAVWSDALDIMESDEVQPEGLIYQAMGVLAAMSWLDGQAVLIEGIGAPRDRRDVVYMRDAIQRALALPEAAHDPWGDRVQAITVAMMLEFILGGRAESPLAQIARRVQGAA